MVTTDWLHNEVKEIYMGGNGQITIEVKTRKGLRAIRGIRTFVDQRPPAERTEQRETSRASR